MSTLLPLVTNSAATAFRTCARKYKLSYVDGVRSRETTLPLRFGTAMHAALESWWQTKSHVAAIECIDHGLDPFERAKALALMAGYHLRWGEEDIVTAFTERQFRVPLLNPKTGYPSTTYELGGKIDAACTIGGVPYLVEHKTTSEDIAQGSVYWKRLRLDTQVSTYLAAAKSFGFEAVGCLYDVIRKIALRPGQIPLLDENGFKIVFDANGNRVRTKDGKKPRETGDADLGYVLQTVPETVEAFHERCFVDVASRPDHYFQRGIVTRLAADEEDAALDLWQTAQMMREARNSGRYPRNASACMQYGRPCDFFPVCTGDTTADNTQLYRKAEQEHEELAT